MKTPGRRDFLRAAGAISGLSYLSTAVRGAAHGRDQDLTLKQVIARHTTARGGARALDAVRAMATEMDIEEKGATVTGHYAATASGLMRIDVYAKGARVWSEGLDREGAWNWPAGKSPSPESTDGAATLRRGVELNLFGLHRLTSRGARLEVAGFEVVEGTRYYVIRVVLSDGFETFLYIDPRSWMITRRRDIRALHPDVDPRTRLLENEFADFRPVNGVRTAFRNAQSDVGAGKVLQKTLFRRIVYNAPANDGQFSRGYLPTV